MEIVDKHVVVTGGASGIGRALIRRFSADGARAVVVADCKLEPAEALAAEVQGLAVALDAGCSDSVSSLIDTATQANGPIDIFISNAGVPGAVGGAEVSTEAWEEAWRVNVMAHVWAARALLPSMIERDEGYLINTASAAGLLTEFSSLPYTVTKHAAVALAEWLAIRYASGGLRISCICPQGVRTPLLDLAMQDPASREALRAGGLLDPEDVAEAVVRGIQEERFLILPHPEVAKQMAAKGWNVERWLAGTRRFAREARAAHVNA